MNEQQLQAQCFQWHWNTYPEERGMLYHNNNNSVNKVVGNRMKAIGVVKGVSDFTLVLPNRVVFIEMKILNGRQSPDQNAFQLKAQERGHIYSIIRDFEDFKHLITTIYG